MAIHLIMLEVVVASKNKFTHVNVFVMNYVPTRIFLTPYDWISQLRRQIEGIPIPFHHGDFVVPETSIPRTLLKHTASSKFSAMNFAQGSMNKIYLFSLVWLRYGLHKIPQ